jgi:HlyD family secretion protein
MNDQAPISQPDPEMILRLGLAEAPKRNWNRRKTLIAVAALALVLIGGAMAFLMRGESTQYVTAAAARQDLAVTVSATGTLQPRDRVDIGAEISGRVDKVLVDFNDHVRRGQVLAELDTDQLRARLAQSEAALASAQANVKQLDATLAQARAAATRAEALFRGDALAQQDLERAQADLARGAASVQKGNADARLAAAAVSADRTALAKAVIRSPIDGVVLNRQVEPGQSVVASLQAPVLFTLASDLKQMELQVDIDEADIGLVREGQGANFSVDAFPQRRFNAKLVSLRNAPKTANGVVTYQGILLVDNSSGLLRPGLTATAEILIDQLRDALLVPNGALRFSPPENLAKAPPLPPAADGESIGRVWVLTGDRLDPKTLRLGRSNGTLTAVLSGPLKAGDAVVTDVKTAPR